MNFELPFTLARSPLYECHSYQDDVLSMQIFGHRFYVPLLILRQCEQHCVCALRFQKMVELEIGGGLGGGGTIGVVSPTTLCASPRTKFGDPITICHGQLPVVTAT